NGLQLMIPLKHIRLWLAVALTLAMVTIAVGPSPAMPCADRAVQGEAPLGSHGNCYTFRHPGCCRYDRPEPPRADDHRQLVRSNNCGCPATALASTPPAIIEAAAHHSAIDAVAATPSAATFDMPRRVACRLPSSNAGSPPDPYNPASPSRAP